MSKLSNKIFWHPLFILSIKMAYQHTTQQPHHQMLCRITHQTGLGAGPEMSLPQRCITRGAFATGKTFLLFSPHTFSVFFHKCTDRSYQKYLFTGREGFPVSKHLLLYGL